MAWSGGTPILIVPLFGFANAGVSLAGLGPDAFLAPLPLAIAAGLVIGKLAGIFGCIVIAERLGIAKPAGGFELAADLGHGNAVRDRLHHEPVHRRIGFP